MLTAAVFPDIYPSLGRREEPWHLDGERRRSVLARNVDDDPEAKSIAKESVVGDMCTIYSNLRVSQCAVVPFLS